MLSWLTSGLSALPSWVAVPAKGRVVLEQRVCEWGHEIYSTLYAGQGWAAEMWFIPQQIWGSVQGCKDLRQHLLNKAESCTSRITAFDWKSIPVEASESHADHHSSRTVAPCRVLTVNKCVPLYSCPSASRSLRHLFDRLFIFSFPGESSSGFVWWCCCLAPSKTDPSVIFALSQGKNTAKNSNCA